VRKNVIHVLLFELIYFYNFCFVCVFCVLKKDGQFYKSVSSTYITDLFRLWLYRTQLTDWLVTDFGTCNGRH